MADLGNAHHNLRLIDNAPGEGNDFEDIDVINMEDEGSEQTDAQGNVISIEHPDGDITISLDGSPLTAKDAANDKWFANLAERMDDQELSGIADELIRLIEDDDTSRKDWLDARAKFIQLLGITVKTPNTSGAVDSPVEGQSQVQHPLLLEANLRFQANARSELLPTDGPVKIRNDSIGSTLKLDRIADALQKDFNHYLTVTAEEYYPDTDRMLWMLGLGGIAFKKVFFCPLRNRPASDSVDAEDLIVNNSAVSLKSSGRITHRVMMRSSVLKRMQLIGAYRDVDLGMPHQLQQSSVQQAKDEQQGITRSTLKPEQNEYELYECYCELDLPGYEHKDRKGETGLPLPYRVTIDKGSRTVLSIVRNYDEDDQELPEARQAFVAYTYVPGFGFYSIGLGHILANTTNAITAGWREMLDAGMFANFPGFLISKQTSRQNTNLFRVPPGGATQIDTGGAPIQHSVMPLPYKEPGPALMNLINKMEETGQRVGGTSELQVGEGRQDAPVGTTLAMIDQATKVMNAVHKRLCQAQGEEFRLLKREFKAHPESFWRHNKKPQVEWTRELLIQALDDHDLVPVADPNTSSQSQRLMKVAGVKQLQSASPMLYDPIAVDRAALRAMGWSNPDEFMAPPEAASRPPPEVQKGMKELEQKDRELGIKEADVQIKRDLAGATIQKDQTSQEFEAARLALDAQGEAEDPMKAAEVESQRQENAIKAVDVMVKHADVEADAANRQQDRESREAIAYTNIVKELIANPETQAMVMKMLPPEFLDKLMGEG